MKDRITYVPYEKTVTVNEYRAPTDLSISLLKEFEEKAQSKIVDSLILNNNYIDGAVVVFEHSGPQCMYTVRFKFILNSHKFTGSFDILREDLWKTSLMEILYTETSKVITQMFMVQYAKIAPNLKSNLQ